jgi:hypothetical protein
VLDNGNGGKWKEQRRCELGWEMGREQKPLVGIRNGRKVLGVGVGKWGESTSRKSEWEMGREEKQ